jgi:tetratricopeptide (TPR) repeat protein
MEDGQMEGEYSVKKAYESILNGDYERAVEWFEEAISADPDNADYYFKCSITCARSGKWHKANDCVEQAIRLDRINDVYRFHQQTIKAKLLQLEAEALLTADSPNHAGAIALLVEAAELDPLLLEAYVLLGTTYGMLANYEKAVAYLKEALRLDPQHAGARKWFAEYNRRKRVRLKSDKSGKTKGNR